MTKKRVKVLHGKRKGYAEGGVPDAPDDALPAPSDFMRTVAENPHGWGNAPGPATSDEAYATPPEPMTPGAAMMKLISGAAKTEPPRMADPKIVGETALGMAGRYPRIASMGLGLLSPIPAGADEANDKAHVMDMQRQLQAAGYYKGKIDGLMRDETATAKAAFDKHQVEQQNLQLQQEHEKAELAKANAAAEETKRQKEADATAVATKQAGEERLKTVESEVPWYRQMLREYGPIAGYIAGAALGPAAKSKVVGLYDEASAAKAAASNKILDDLPDLPGRVAGVNQFWAQGGKGTRAPFVADPNADLGFRPNSMVAPASKLYQPSKLGPIVSDLGVAGTFGGESAYGQMVMAPQAQAELEKAQDAVGADPSEVNIQRLQAAKDRMAMAEFVTNMGRLGSASYLGAGFKYGRQPVRPNVAGAEAERIRINQELTGKSPSSDLPALPAPAPAPRVIIKSSAGTYHDERGHFTSAPPKKGAGGKSGDND